MEDPDRARHSTCSFECELGVLIYFSGLANPLPNLWQSTLGCCPVGTGWSHCENTATWLPWLASTGTCTYVHIRPHARTELKRCMYSFMCMYEYALVSSCATCVQKPMSESLELELQAVKNSPMWMLALVPLDRKGASALNHSAMFLAPNKS